MGTEQIVSARGWAIILFLALRCGLAAAGPSESNISFDQANRLYEQGKFAEAATAYESFLASNAPTANAWFNLGNAAYKSGQLGRAIAAYRLAERLAPRDADLRANLDFVRGKIYTGDHARLPLWQTAVRSATLNEWTALTMGGFWAACFVLGAGEWTRRRYFKTAALLFAGTALAGSGLAASMIDLRAEREAVVIAREVTARFGPLDESQSAFQLRDGAEVRVLGTKGGWLWVRDVEQRPGWIRRDEAIVMPGAFGPSENSPSK